VWSQRGNFFDVPTDCPQRDERLGWMGDAQAFIGRPRKVTMYAVKVHNPDDASAVVAKINATIDGTHAALAGEFAEQMPDMEAASGMMDGISALAIMVGGGRCHEFHAYGCT